MKKTAVIFPGQGAQKSGMGRDLYENSKAAEHVFKTADKVLGFSVSEMCFNGSEEDLRKTINSQPCIVTVEIAAYEALKEQTGIKFDAAAGHSLGEYLALYAAGAADLETILKLIQKRAELMNEASLQTNGAMAAVIGLDCSKVNKILETLDNVYAANFNSPEQIVITGEKEAVNSSIEVFKDAGAKKAVPLAVSGAFHSPFMRSAGDKFKTFIEKFDFKDSNINVYTNIDAVPEKSGEIFRKKLPVQMYSSVCWLQTINAMEKEGIMKFIEAGPGRVLAGLNKKINPALTTLNVFDWESLIKTSDSIKEKEFV